MLVAPKFATKINPRVMLELSEDAPPWGPAGFVTYARTYSRNRPDLGRNEHWHESIERCLNGILDIGGVFTHEQITELAYYWYNLKGCPAGRPLWQLGTETVKRLGGDSLQNCFAGETQAITKQGVFPIRELVGREVEVQVKTDNGLQWVKTIFRGYGKQHLMKVTFADGSSVRATPTHQWIMSNGGKVNLGLDHRVFTQDLMSRSRAAVPLEFDRQYKWDPEGYAHGFTFGDGTAHETTCHVEIFPAKTDMLELLSGYGKLRNWCLAGVDTPVVCGLPKNWKSLPTNVTREYALGFVLGLASADGSVDNRLRIHNKSCLVLLDIQKLARFAGLRCHAPYLDREISPLDGSEKPLWCITISTYNLEKTDFIRDDQAARLQNTRIPLTVEVTSVEDLGIEEEVFCCVVPDWHNFTLANGVVTGQCWHVVCDEPVDPFCFAFNELMLGGGVGFNILPENVYAIPPVKHSPSIERVESFDCDYIVTDNREGWVELLRRVLHAHFYSGKALTYCTRGVRNKGSLINGFGGTASGPEDLVKGIKLICKILSNARGRKLRPVECMDIMNIIAMIVVAGNVRRSAEIAIGDFMDEEYLFAKDWSRFAIPEWRQQSNNTVRCHDTCMLPEHFWNGYNGSGEPYGLYNEDLCKHFGRTSDQYDYRPDLLIKGPNPCAEILLENYEACNLAEIFLSNISSPSEFSRVAALLFRAAKAIGSLDYIHPRTTEVVQRNNRIGIGITGYLGSDYIGNHEVFDAVYDHLEETDVELSKQMNRGKSIKMTCVKPSGTLSLLAGVSPGVHPAFSPYYIRRIQFAAANPLLNRLRATGHNMEPKVNIDGSRNYDTIVVDFPHAMPEGTICAADLTAVEQLENQSFLQRHWADNAVSMTCYYQKEELPDVREWLRENYSTDVKTASFLLHQGHGFQQAPYEQITRDQYLELSGRTQPLTSAVIEDDFVDISTDGCEGGACPVR